MMMVVDTSKSEKKVSEMADDLESLGREIGVVIRVQREDIFDSMHRI